MVFLLWKTYSKSSKGENPQGKVFIRLHSYRYKDYSKYVKKEISTDRLIVSMLDSLLFVNK